MKNKENKIVPAVLTAFALLTLFLSSSVIFDWFEIRAREGSYVLFIVWANFISSILYLTTVYGYINNLQWMTKPILISLVILILAQIGLFIHVVNGGLYETKTVGAMIFRIVVTGIFTYLVSRKNNNLKKNRI